MDEGKLLELLVKLGYISKDNALRAQKEKAKDEDIISTLLRLGFIDDNKLIEFYQKYMPQRLWRESPQEVVLPEEIKSKLSENFLRQHTIAPVKYEDGKLVVLTINPFNQTAINELRFKTKINTIVPYISTKKSIEDLINKLYPALDRIVESLDAGEVEIEAEEMELSPELLAVEAGEGPIVKLANFIITEAVNLGASDIHIEPQEKKLQVRYRVDGVLKVYHEFPTRIKDSLVARFKIMSNLDIAEKRKPQDGRIRTRIKGKKIDLRVSTVPTVYGEKTVMRIQEAEKYLNVKLDDLGFEPDDLEKFRKAIWTPWGMVLVTGPTGSGKTTTLYASLMERNSPEV
ncbi:MAG: ATPase, T2SS/T4P/T4SS family, partial [Aquificaceae bacterium]|nr:ATPase, T2SS/T4P/T4SS family [Aquificaceae bacterium]